MELKLSELTTIIAFLKSANYWALPLLFSIVIPAFYIAFKKLVDNTPTGETGVKAIILNFFKLPQIDSWVVVSSVLLFMLGCVTVVFGANRQEKIRLKGLAVKAYLYDLSYTRMQIEPLAQALHTNTSCLEKLSETFPADFIITYEKAGDTTVRTFILVDSIIAPRILTNATRQLNAYLDNTYVLTTGSQKAFVALFNQNNVFTFETCYKLISDSSHKYTMNLDTSGMPVIVRKKPFLQDIKLLNAYLQNDMVLTPATGIISFTKLTEQNNAFSRATIEQLIADSAHKYSMNMVNNSLNQFGIVRIK